MCFCFTSNEKLPLFHRKIGATPKLVVNFLRQKHTFRKNHGNRRKMTTPENFGNRQFFRVKTKNVQYSEISHFFIFQCSSCFFQKNFCNFHFLFCFFPIFLCFLFPFFHLFNFPFLHSKPAKKSSRASYCTSKTPERESVTFGVQG